MNNNIVIPFYLLKQELPQSGGWIEPPFERKRHMPFGALAGSIIGIGAAVGVTVGATTALVISTIIIATTVVGLALTVAGAVTGNKTLLKVGGIMSLAGGVASLAVTGLAAAIDVGVFGAEAAASSTAAQAAATAANPASTAAEVAAAASKADNAMTLTDAGQAASKASTSVQGMYTQATQAANPILTVPSSSGLTGAINTTGTKIVDNAVKPLADVSKVADVSKTGGDSFLSQTMDFLKTPSGVMLAGNLGKDMLAAPLAQKQNAQNLSLANQKLDIERADLALRQKQTQQSLDLQDNQSKNLNTLGQINLHTTPLTAEQDNQDLKKAKDARNIILAYNGKK